MLKSVLRKLQVVGGSTLTVSLPKEWAKATAMKGGDYVAVIPQQDGSLVLAPRENIEIIPSSSEISIDTKLDPVEAGRELIAEYLSGYDTITVKFAEGTSEHRALIKQFSRKKLIGAEIINETSEQLVVQCFVGPKELPIKKATRRMGAITLSMVNDAIEALKLDDKELARNVVERDDEVDRFYLFGVRQLKMAVTNQAILKDVGFLNVNECLGYRIVMKSIERAADHAARISNVIESREKPLDDIADIEKMRKLAVKVFTEILDSLRKSDGRRANKALVGVDKTRIMYDKLSQKLLKLRRTNQEVWGLETVIESLKKIADYGEDIAEVVINSSSDESSGR